MSRFVISALRVGPEDLRDQLPAIGATVDVRTGPDGQGYVYARLDDPLKHRTDTHLDTRNCSPELLGYDDAGPFFWVSDIVMRPSIPGQQPHFGMQAFPVDLAFVIDLSLLDDPGIDFAKILPIATAEIDDIPDQLPTDPPPTADEAPPTDLPAPVSSTPPVAAPPAKTDATTAAPASSNVATSAAPLDVEPRRRSFSPGPDRPNGRAVTSRSTSAPQPARPPRPRPTEAPAPAAPLPGPDAQHRPLGGPYPPHPTPPPRSSPPPPVFAATPNRRGPSKRTVAVSAVVLVGVVLIIFAGWSLLTSQNSADTAVNPAPTASPADIQRVKSLVPKGYLDRDRDCTPTPGTDRPSLTCSSNADPGGPQSATYTIYPDRQSLQEAFTTSTATFDRTVCPGNIQSPGPWRRNAAPTQVAGTLFCGTQGGHAVVVWTSDAQALLNVAEAGAQGPSLAQLYTWWTFHS
ncbi:MAG: hypothetical protein K2X52_00205 [Mycobacteriaceae bacterium]|nr:hypothetical protein [Mycobacteriaceae bacterium]